jgi:hypothetical protein
LLAYDHQIRIIFASISVVISYYSFNLINKTFKNFDEIEFKTGAAMIVGVSGLTYWLMFNVHDYLNPDIGVVMICSLALSAIGVILGRGESGVLQYPVSTGIVIGLFVSQVIQIHTGNIFSYSLYSISIFVGFFISLIQNLGKKIGPGKIDMQLVILAIFMANGANHFLEPSYVSTLLSPGIP